MTSNSHIKDSILRIPKKIIKDPVRYPKIQIPIESAMKSNYNKSLQAMLIDITKILSK